jgi:phosphoribosylamine--glycine ligase
VGGSHRILIVGSGGREHALAWRLSRDPEVERVTLAPGNDGIARSFRCHDTQPSDVEALVERCRIEDVTLAVVGPEAPLAAGLADALRSAGVACYGPSRAAAQLEASKSMAKGIMEEAGVPTARARAFESLAAALAALAAFGPPWVLKVDGLASGKGVLVTGERGEAERFLEDCLEHGGFGEAGRRVLIEEFLAGEEVSLMAVCDGRDFLLLPPARDYKRAHDGDRGLNTGGMGAFAPSPSLDRSLEAEVGERVVRPVLAAMAQRGTPYRGTLYVGLMCTTDGPRVVEFNCRFGDPETQVVLPLLEGSLARLLASAAAGRLEPETVERGEGAAVSVAVVDQGYPGPLGGEGTVEGLDLLMRREDLVVFHAAIAREGDTWRVAGGRALHVTARAASREQARARVYEGLGTLGGRGWRYRSDIAAAPDSSAGSAPLTATASRGAGRA